MRKVKDAVDLETGEKIYFRGHAQATFMSDGRTVEQAIKSGGGSGGGSYDDTEIREQLTELSAEVNEVADKINNINPTPMTPITYADLVSLRDNGGLVAGSYYRITDYITTTAQENTQSAGHPFDVIVLALSENTLAEDAYAIQSARDTDGYFAECNLSAWKLWYSLDNNTERFAWADEVNGKGVIYRMIDEWENDCPYDFKNIQFKRFAVAEYDKVPSLVVDNEENYYGYYYGALNLYGEQAIQEAIYGEDFIWAYTFALKDLATETWHDYTILNSIGLKTDESVIITCHSNVIKEHRDEYLGEHGRKAIWLNNIVFFNCYADISSPDYSDDYSYCNFNSFGNGCSSNSFGNGCNYNSFGNGCNYNNFGNDCYSNSFGNDCYYNSFDNYCSSNSFDNGCSSNSFGDSCYSNSFGDSCSSNSFGNDCYSNSFGNGCSSNNFGNDCSSNNFGNYCNSNSFGNYCYYNSFGDSCYSNSFGDSCYSNSFGDSCSSNNFGNYCYSNSFGNGCYYNNFGNDCSSNNFGNYCNSNSFGNYCYYNSFGEGCYANTFVDDSDKAAHDIEYCRYDDGVHDVTMYYDDISDTYESIMNIHIFRGVHNVSYTPIADTEVEQSFCCNRDGEIVRFVLVDIITKVNDFVE